MKEKKVATVSRPVAICVSTTNRLGMAFVRGFAVDGVGCRRLDSAQVREHLGWELVEGENAYLIVTPESHDPEEIVKQALESRCTAAKVLSWEKAEEVSTPPGPKTKGKRARAK